eukprot:TRINITY_DN4230_c0_g1_i1.p2 TRINITY_DN4230_c0_g1~~TRINITY_DN4230_c0_g1_i1.p2  ORF type:complete len:118 (+),score=34.60 TRINITY_DN4230_c0_g1_i1:41-355(+)
MGEHVRNHTAYFEIPNGRQLITEAMEAHYDLYRKEQIQKLQKRAVSAPSAVAADIEITNSTGTNVKKPLGEDATKKLQDLITERLSGEDGPVPVNNLLQSLSQE